MRENTARFQPAALDEWRAWLAEHHQDRPEGVWLVLWRAGSGGPRIPYDELVEQALCFGWIDSTGRALDAGRTMVWFTPRKAGSGWSRLNKQRIERLAAAGAMAPAGLALVEAAKADGSWTLLDAGRTMVWFTPRRARSGWSRLNKQRIDRLTAAGEMAPAGLALVEAAKADGSWTLLDAVEDLTVPPDLEAAFAATPPAGANWDAFPRSAKRAMLLWIVQARRPATRAARVAEVAGRAAVGERANSGSAPR